MLKPGSNTTTYGQAFDGRDNAVSTSLGLSFNDEILSYLGQGDKTEAQKNYATAVAAQLFEASEAEKSRMWQEDMSNSSYQRAVKDMIAAGINPALAYQQGGASTPAGAMAHGKASSGGNDTLFSSLAKSLLSTAVGAAGGIAGKAIGARIASSAASERLSQKLEYDMIKQTKNQNT